MKDFTTIEQVQTLTIFTGVVLDYDNGSPVAYATIQLFKDGNNTGATAADINGRFAIKAVAADTLQISSAGYQTNEVAADIYDGQNYSIIEMRKDVKEIDPVVLPPGTRSNINWLWLLPVAYFVTKEKAVGKIDTSTVLTVGLGVMLLKGFKLFDGILEGLGLSQSQAGHDYDEQVSNPNSFWSAAFWKAAPAGSKLLKTADMQNMKDAIEDAFGVFGDDEAKVIGVFKSLQTQSQLSFFADWFQQQTGNDLLKYLKGTDYWPNDHLSVQEISVITDYIKRLPKYY